MKNILTIIKKELSRVFTDKRMILSLFLLPPLTIYLIYGLMGMSAQKETQKVEEYVPTVYIINQPSDISLNEKSIQFSKHIESEYKSINLVFDNFENEEALIERVNNQEFDLLIVFPNDFNEKITSSTTPNIVLYYNINNSLSQSTYFKFVNIMNNYRNEILTSRFDAESLTVFLTTPIQKGNVEKAQGQMLSMLLPLLIVIYLMAGAMGIGIESISGEKERGTIATLLVTPIKRSELAIGKIISISIIGLISSLTSFIGLVAVLPSLAQIEGGEGVGGMAAYGAMDYLMILGIMLVAVLFFVTLIVIISAYAKTVKEAGTLIMPLYLLVMGGAMINMFNNNVDKTITPYLIPVYNIILALEAAFSFDLLGTNWLITIISTLLYTFVLIFIIQKMFRSEKIMFNK